MHCKISVVACAVLMTYFTAYAADITEREGVKHLEAVEVNSVGDNVSESGIDEGFLTKNIQQGPLAGMKMLDVPYQINTITKEVMNHQGVTGFEDVVKYFPSAQIQMRGGTSVGRTMTRGFVDGVVGNVFWDGFYAASTTAIPMAMFESLQVQNGLAGSLYGSQYPSGIFNYTRKRPVENEHTFWADWASRENIGLGIDSSMKFEKFGYRGVFYASDGAKQVKDSNHQRRLASVIFEFYPTDALTFETAASYYEHNTQGLAGQFTLGVTNGRLTDGLYVPKAVDNSKKGLGQTFGGMNLKTTFVSGKFKFSPSDNWYYEGGIAFQRVDRDTHPVRSAIIPRGKTLYGFTYQQDGDFVTGHTGGASAAYRFNLPSAYLKANTEFETFDLQHNFTTQANGYSFVRYRYTNPSTAVNNIGRNNLYNPISYGTTTAKKGSDLYKYAQTDMENISFLDDVKINDSFSLLLSLSNTWIKSELYNTATKSLQKTYSKSGLSYGASLIYHPIDDVSVYFTYADSLQAGDPGTNSDGSTVVLDPYRSKQYEIGAKARLGEFDVSAALFEIKRPIAYLSSVTGLYGVQGEQVNRGFELMTGGKITNDLSVLGGITLIDPKLKNTRLAEANNKVVNGVPKVQANMLFDYVVPGTQKLAISTNFHYTGKMYVDDLNTAYTPSFFVTDIGVRYVSKTLLGKQTTFRFNVNNLFNKKYWAGMYPADIDGGGGFGSTSVLGSANGLSLGESRTFMLSAEVKF